jgi:uncharacterized protein YecT (DUF1311 family)
MRFPAIAIALCAALPAAAQESGCGGAMVQSELNACAERDWLAEDARLNAAYERAIAAMREIDGYQTEPGAEEALRTAQRAWVAMRDAHCTAASYHMRGGSAEPLVVFGCRTLLTTQRIADLELLSEQ